MATGYGLHQPSGSSQEKNLICPVCREVFTSPRLLPCFHTFCLDCLKGLVASHGNFFPCPSCRKLTRVPDGGVCAFQANFYITEEELKQAREPSPRKCPGHSDERLRFFCLQCDVAICLMCKLTKHEGHRCEDLPEAAARSKERLVHSQGRLEECIKLVERKLTEFQEDQMAVVQKRDLIQKEIEMRHAALVVAADKWRDRAKKGLEDIVKGTNENLSTSTQDVQKTMDFLLNLQYQVQHVQENGSPADLVEMDREMRSGRGRYEKEIEKLKTTLPTSNVKLMLRCDVTGLCDDDIRRFIGCPATISTEKQNQQEAVEYVGNLCSEGDKRVEVDAICTASPEDSYVRAVCSSSLDERDVIQSDNLLTDGGPEKLNTVTDHDGKVSLFLFPGDVCPFMIKKRLSVFSKSTIPFTISKRTNDICSADNTDGELKETRLFSVKVSAAMALDANCSGMLFAVLEETQKHAFNEMERNESASATKSPTPTGEEDDEPVLSGGPSGGTVRFFYNGHSDPIATYTPPQPTSLLTDVCFCHVDGQEKLLVSDWMNDAIHVVNVPKAWVEKDFDLSGVQSEDLRFERYLAAGSVQIVRPTAMNTDTRGNILIGCGDGSVLRCNLA